MHVFDKSLSHKPNCFYNTPTCHHGNQRSHTNIRPAFVDFPQLQRATIQNAITGNLEFADYRISKSAWLKQEEDLRIRSIRRRVEAYTNLDIETAEDLQVVNYGIGGHYEPHFDFARVGVP